VPEKDARYLHGRRRANSTAANSRATSPRPSTAGHNRASSEFSTPFLKDGSDGGSSLHGNRLARPQANPSLGTLAMNSSLSLNPLSAAAGPRMGTNDNTNINNSNNNNTNHMSNIHNHNNNNAGPVPHIKLGASSAAPFLEVVSTSPFSMPQSGMSSQSSLPSQSSSERETHNLYVETDDDSVEPQLQDPDDIPILEREGDLDELHEDEKPSQNRGWSWDELIDRLLCQPMCRGDETFVIIFLCFYRKFSTPRELLNAIMDRFDKTTVGERIRIHRIATHLRYCNVLHQWATTHPGDFANSRTKQQLAVFLDRISKERAFAFLIREIKRAITLGVEDDDYMWAKCDTDGNTAEREREEEGEEGEVDSANDSLKNFLKLSTTFGDSSPSSTGSEWKLSLDRSSTLQVPGTKRISESNHSSTAYTELSTPNPPQQPPTNRLTYGQFDQFMSIPVEEIAGELTRIDWHEFSRITPRDLLRHISVSVDSREKFRNLRAVNNMITHFNHVAYWVASVILEKQKPKHRARALEKFIEVAWVRIAF
jgi:hypothetical protein